jgi:hypothetical protein
MSEQGVAILTKKYTMAISDVKRLCGVESEFYLDFCDFL